MYKPIPCNKGIGFFDLCKKIATIAVVKGEQPYPYHSNFLIFPMTYFFYALFTALGAFIAWVVYRIRTAKLQFTAKQQERQIRHLHEDFQRKEKDLNLEIMARDKKINSAQKKYEALQSEIEQAQVGIDSSLQEQDKLYLELKAEYDALKQQIQKEKAIHENILAERDHKIVTIQAERDNVKLKWENAMQDHAVNVLKSDLRLREIEVENLKRELASLKQEK